MARKTNPYAQHGVPRPPGEDEEDEEEQPSTSSTSSQEEPGPQGQPGPRPGPHEQREQEAQSGAAPSPKGRKRKKGRPPKPKPDPLPAALAHLRAVAPNVDAALATEALQAVRDKNPEVSKDMDWWVDEAQMHLAIHNEVDAEAVGLREAMAASLAEINAERARLEAEEERLGKAAAVERKFGGSAILAKLAPVCQLQALLVSKAAEPLKRLLALEKRSKQWYTGRGTYVYFEALGEELAGHVAQLAADHQPQCIPLPLQCCDPAPTSQPADPAAAQGPGTSASAAQAPEPASASCSALSDGAAACLALFAARLEEKESFIQEECARMPPAGAGATYIPPLFRLPAGMDEVEVVPCYSDSE